MGRFLSPIIVLALCIVAAVGSAQADERLLLGLPEPGGKWLWRDDTTLGKLLLAASEKTVDALDSAEAKAEFASLISQAETLIANEHGRESRTMATFLAETMSMWWGLAADEEVIARGRRAIAIERQLNANAVYWSDFLGFIASPVETVAVGHVLDATYDMYTDPDTQQASAARLKETAFEFAQSAFVTKGSREAIRRLRLDPGLEATSLEQNKAVLMFARWLEAYAEFEELTAADLFGKPGTADRAKADAEVGRQNKVADDAAVLLRTQAVDVPSTLFPRTISFEALAPHLHADEALLLITPGSVYIHIFLVTDQGIDWQVTEADILQFYDRIDALRAAMGVPRARGAAALTAGAATTDNDSVIENARWLYRQLVEPVEAGLAKRSRLLVAATDSVAAFPIEALVVSDAAAGTPMSEVDWLVRHHAVIVLPAVELVPTRTTTRTALTEIRYLAFGAPDYEATISAGYSGKARQLVATLPALPEAGDEVRGVAAGLPEASTYVLTGRDADELRLEYLSGSGELAGYDVVHFATHGLLPGDHDDSVDPAIALSPVATSPPIELNASFYFRVVPDGLLTDIEISTLQFDADLVVLSACNSGAPSPDSPEAYSGLAAAFLGAGARRVLVSHWPVDSQAAVDIVTATLRMGFANGDMAQAQRQAVLALITEGGAKAHPRHWAPFSLYGEP